MAILIQKYPKKYFGINETTNIFTGDAVPIDVTDEYFQIPSVVNIQGEEWVAVNTGYVPLATQPTDDFEFEICDDNGDSLQKLDLIIGTVKDPSSKPASNIVVWFNEAFVKGCYYINSKWLGKVFHIIRGKYISTTANSNRLNEISSSYNFENNIELAINDTIDSNNINVTYSDSGSYITETKKANNKNIINNGYNFSSSIIETQDKIDNNKIKVSYSLINNYSYQENKYCNNKRILPFFDNFTNKIGKDIDYYTVNSLNVEKYFIDISNVNNGGEILNLTKKIFIACNLIVYIGNNGSVNQYIYIDLADSRIYYSNTTSATRIVGFVECIYNG